MKRWAVLAMIWAGGCLPQPQPDDSAVTAILNGPTLSQTTTHWRQPNCFIQINNSCRTTFHVALAADGTMQWSVEPEDQNVGDPRWGISTWTRLGDDALVLNDLPFKGVSSRALTDITGSVSSGVFSADYESTNNAGFTIMTGALPGYCACGAGLPNATASCVESRDGYCGVSSCNTGFSDCDGKAPNGCEASLTAPTSMHVTALECAADGGVTYAGCASTFADCDGNPGNGCEASLTPSATLNATALVCAADGGTTYSGCANAFADCDGVALNGCEASLTPSPALHVAALVCAADGGTIYAGCAGGFLDCDGSPTNGCENAGACPDRLSFTPGVRLIADLGYLYWTSDGGVHRLPLDGGPEQALASGEGGPRGLALTPTHVFWSNVAGSPIHGLSKTPRAGGTIDRMYVGNVGYELAADDVHVYWSDYVNVDRMTHDAGLNAIQIVGQYGTGGVALADGVLWTTTDMGEVWCVPLDGGAPVKTTPAQQAPAVAITVQGGDVFWSANNGIFRMGTDGGMPQKVAAGGTNTVLAVDGARVFWASDAGVFSTPLGGGADTIYSSQPATSVAVDGTHVYWTNGFGVFRAPR